MGTAIAILGFVAIVAGIGLLFRKGRRKLGAYVALGGVVVFFIGAAIGGTAIQEEKARAAGFESVAEHNAASAAGFTDAAAWRAHQAEVKAKQEADARAAEERARQAALEEQRRKAAAEANCPKDLKCWGEKHSAASTGPCTRVVERLAKNSHKWTDSWYEPKFSHFRWAGPDKKVITYIGDKIQYQNGFGAWINHTYECDFDPALAKVVDARAHPGRLPE